MSGSGEGASGPTPKSQYQIAAERIPFWSWARRRGLGRFVDRWLLLHGSIGLVLAFASSQPLSDLARSVLIPVAAILAGVTFAWGGNAVTTLRAPEIEEMGDEENGEKFSDLAFTYQMAVFVVTVVLVCWTLAAADLFGEGHRLLHSNYWLGKAGRCLLFFLTSVAVRECWQVVSGTQAQLVSAALIRRAKRRRDKQGASAEHPDPPSRVALGG